MRMALCYEFNKILIEYCLRAFWMEPVDTCSLQCEQPTGPSAVSIGDVIWVDCIDRPCVLIWRSSFSCSTFIVWVRLSLITKCWMYITLYLISMYSRVYYKASHRLVCKESVWCCARTGSVSLDHHLSHLLNQQKYAHNLYYSSFLSTERN